MAYPLLPDTIDAVADRLAAGQDSATIRAAIGLGRNSLAGIIHRLRKRGDPRVRPAGAGAVVSAARQRDLLAEAFANGAPTIAKAARIAKMSEPTARAHWAAICAQFGWQAR